MLRLMLLVASLTLVLESAGCNGDSRRGDGDDVAGDSDTDSDTDTGYDGPPIPVTCQDAASAMTSVGCEFYVADMDNWDDSSGMSESADPLNYSVVVSNPQDSQDANVVLEDGFGTELVGFTLASGELQVINVACESGCYVPAAEVNIQGIGEQSGFRLTSDVPVTAYQWNPYGHEIFTTDASLLIPVSSLSGTYIVASWPTASSEAATLSQVMIVGAEDGTSLTIIPTVSVTAHGGIGPLEAGVESAPFVLNAADVMTIRTDGTGADLTGTVVQADKNVVVFGGNSCANVPDTTCCCDHVEEQLLPLEAWGTSTVLARHAPRANCSAIQDTALWRVIAGADDMIVQFDPPAPAPYGAQYHFAQQGETIQFQSADDHFASGHLGDSQNLGEPDTPFFAYQMMNGALKASCGPEGGEGDPMMLLSPPAGQYLNRYVFNTDNVFDFSYDHIIVVRPAGVTVELDCLGELPDAEFAAVGSTAWEVGRFFIDDPTDSNACTDGAHVISSVEPFGISVVGTDFCQSYGYLGGVGVRSINPNPVVE